QSIFRPTRTADRFLERRSFLFIRRVPDALPLAPSVVAKELRSARRGLLRVVAATNVLRCSEVAAPFLNDVRTQVRWPMAVSLITPCRRMEPPLSLSWRGARGCGPCNV